MPAPSSSEPRLGGETMAAVGAVLALYGLYSGFVKRDPLPTDSWLIQLLAQLMGGPPDRGLVIAVFVGLGLALVFIGLEIRRKSGGK
jgi:hypothetical protein